MTINFSVIMSLSVHAVTWNVAKYKKPFEWICKHISKETDFIVLGLQEANYSCEHYQATIQSNYSEYDIIAAEQFTGFHNSYLLTFVLVHNKTQAIYNFAKLNSDNIRFDSLRRNKGAIAITVYSDKRKDIPHLRFINAHLHAHKGNFFYKQRIKDLKSILTKWSDRVDTLLLGDLNFRMGKDNLSKFDPKEDGLTKAEDELGLIWQFTESPITFEPTFKYIRHSNELDGKRTPSWTDRILFAGFNYSLSPSHTLYERIDDDESEGKNPSDHIPVEFIATLHVSPFAYPDVNPYMIRNFDEM